MVIKPKIRGFICTNAHPQGCAAHVQEQIDYIKSQGPLDNGPKNVLVVGASTGYGLASRITAAFGCEAKTLGVFFEKEGTERKTASAGWYNTAAFQKAADDAGLWSKNINGDAFSDEIKQKTIDTIKAEMGKVDLVVYSLASPRRKCPKTGEIYSSTLKPTADNITIRGLNTTTRTISDVKLDAASEQEIADTVKVMGGEDWELWIDALKEADVLANNFKTAAYTYIGSKITLPMYGHATIGRAKDDLDRATEVIKESTKELNGEAYVASLNAVVTQASSAIPIMPLYISSLFKVMKDDGTYEGTIEQINGLFRENLYGDNPRFDAGGHLSQNYKELEQGVQDKVENIWFSVETETLDELTDYTGYHQEFLRLFGFGIDDVDYDTDITPNVAINNLI
jgi:enoyl-[acyl-carrier protein] reductase / trans-2-enoyl-CoA reductase (NAD+)